jgi:hypothetical protein
LAMPVTRDRIAIIRRRDTVTVTVTAAVMPA